ITHYVPTHPPPYPIPPTPKSTLFPYTTLFRSYQAQSECKQAIDEAKFVVFSYYANPVAQKLIRRRVKSGRPWVYWGERPGFGGRSEEHTSESSHRTISYAVFCLKKKKKN